MSRFHTQLLDVALGQDVNAEMDTVLDFNDLLDAESYWTPHRYGLIKQLNEQGIPSDNWPQHWHWNWVSKFAKYGSLDIGNPLSDLRLMGIIHNESWQGLVLVTSVGHQSRLGQGGKDLIYVKYLEAAPWNLRVPEVGQVPKYRGTGRQLLEMAIQLSVALGLKGRVGLHALPQAESFYRRYHMADLGMDQASGNLRYFELSEDQARVFLQGGIKNNE